MSDQPAPLNRVRTYGKPRPMLQLGTGDEVASSETPGHKPDFFPHFPSEIDVNSRGTTSRSRYNFGSSPSKSHAAFASSVRGLLLSPTKSNGGGASDAGSECGAKDGNGSRKYDDGEKQRSRFAPMGEDRTSQVSEDFSDIIESSSPPITTASSMANGRPSAYVSRKHQFEPDEEDEDEDEGIDPAQALALLRASMMSVGSLPAPNAVDHIPSKQGPLDIHPDRSTSEHLGEADETICLPATQQDSSPPNGFTAEKTPAGRATSKDSILRKILGGSSELSAVPPLLSSPDQLGSTSADRGRSAINHEAVEEAKDDSAHSGDEDQEETAPPVRMGTSHHSARRSHRRKISDSSASASDAVASQGSGAGVTQRGLAAKGGIGRGLGVDAQGPDSDDLAVAGPGSSPVSPVSTRRYPFTHAHSTHSGGAPKTGKPASKRRVLMSSSSETEGESSRPIGIAAAPPSARGDLVSEKVRGKMRMVDADVELDQVRSIGVGGRRGKKGRSRREDVGGTESETGSGSELGGIREGARGEKVKPLSKQEQRQMRTEQNNIRQQKVTRITGVSTAVTVGSFMSEMVGIIKPRKEKPMIPLSTALPGLTISSGASVESQLGGLISSGVVPALSRGAGGGANRHRDDALTSDGSMLLETPEDDITAFSSATRDNVRIVDLVDGDEGDSMDLEADSPSAQRGTKGVVRSGLEFRRMSGPERGIALKPFAPLGVTSRQEGGDLFGQTRTVDIESGEEGDRLTKSKRSPDRASNKREALMEMKRKALAAEKAAAATKHGVTAQRSTRDGARSQSDSDGFEIEQSSSPPKATRKLSRHSSGKTATIRPERATIVARARTSDPRTKLANFVPKANAGGKIAELHNESVFQNAGKQFNHAGLVENGKHARQAGVKSNKYVIVSSADVTAKLLEDARRQSALQVAQRAKDAGHTPRELAPKQDITEQIHIEDDDDVNMSSAASDSEPDNGDDPEDEDFDPDRAGQLEHQGDGGDSDQGHEDAMSIVYSGDEEEGLKQAKHIPDIVVSKRSDDKENIKPEDAVEAEEVDLLHRKSRRTVQIITDSDDEADHSVGVTVAFEKPDGEAARKSEVDGAFGDGADFGEGGFSQLFGATQAFTQADEGGFAGMRLGTADIMAKPAIARPVANLSATAVQRNAALLNEELLDAAERAAECRAISEEPAPRYLNEQGLFTQTKPAIRVHAALSSEDSFDEESLPTAGFNLGFTAATGLEATYRSEVGHSGASDERHTTPDSPELGLRRLKRRRSSLARDESFQSTVDVDAIPGDEPDTSIRSTSQDASPTRPVDPPAAENLPAPPLRNAFTVLQQLRPKRDEAIRALDRDAAQGFVEQEAAESEDEDGFGDHRRDDDEQEDDNEGYVEGLVDDQERTAEEKLRDEAAAAALARQHEEEDDKRREAVAKDAAEGKFRTKRRDGDLGDLELSDDEDENKRRKKESRRARRARKAARDLGDGVSAPWKKTYQDDLNMSDDDDEMPFEDEESQAAVLRRRTSASPPYEPQNTRHDANDIRTETIGMAEIQRQARAMADQQRRKDGEAKRKAEAEAERGAPAKRSRIAPEFMTDDIDTDDEDPDEESQFSIKRASQTASLSRLNSVSDDAKYARHLATDPQAHQDSRKAGGNSSVMGGGRTGGSLGSRTNSNAGPGGNGKGPVRNQSTNLPRTGSLQQVMGKKNGFGN